jgi:hypothetical protein
VLRSCACLIWFLREGRHPVDSSEPAVNFLGRREFMAKMPPRQVPLVWELLGSADASYRPTKSPVHFLRKVRSVLSPK